METEKKFPKAFFLSAEVARALSTGAPLVALETAVLTHGLPYPTNVQLAYDMETQVRAGGAVPATVGVLDGRIRVGLSSAEVERLGKPGEHRKISRRDFAPALVQGASGGTTVAGTLVAANSVGIKVFATGGIGGVHRDAPFDVSTDLPELERTPLIVVCAGAKSILDLPATLEYLETAGVPVVGYQTDEFPAFYARSSDLPVPFRAESSAEIVEIARAHWQLGLNSAVLVVTPPPAEVALPAAQMEAAIEQALAEAKQAGIHGQAVTPFLLARTADLTGGASLRANLGLLLNNARLAAEIARHLAAVTPQPGRSHV